MDFKPDLEAAGGAGHRLCVKSAVEWVFVFLFARRAEWETGHGGVGPIIRDVVDDAKARAAVCAVDEGVTITAVGRIEEFSLAVRADRDVGRNRDKFTGLGLAFVDRELRITVWWTGLAFYFIDSCQGRA